MKYNADEIVYKDLRWSIKKPSYSHELQMCEGFIIKLTSRYKYPNLFHRFMQRLFFGFKYKKL